MCHCFFHIQYIFVFNYNNFHSGDTTLPDLDQIVDMTKKIREERSANEPGLATNADVTIGNTGGSNAEDNNNVHLYKG